MLVDNFIYMILPKQVLELNLWRRVVIEKKAAGDLRNCPVLQNCVVS